MKISMWNLADWLKGYEIQCLIEAGNDTIESVRMLAGDNYDPGIAYVSRNIPGDRTVMIAHRHDIIQIKNADTDEIFNEVFNALECFNRWEETLLEVCSAEDGLQRMLNVSESILCSPTFLYDSAGEILAITDSYPPDINEHWAELLQNRRIPDTTLRKFKSSGNFTHVFTDREPKMRASAFSTYHYMHRSLFVQENAVGHLVCFDFTEPFPLGIRTTMKTLAYYMEKHIVEFYYQYQSCEIAPLVRRMLNGDPSINPDRMISALKTIRWSMRQRFQLCVIEESAEAEPVLISRIYSTLNKGLYASYLVPSKWNITVISNVDILREPLEKYNRRITNLISNGLHCCFSSIFYDFEHLSLYHKQVCSLCTLYATDQSPVQYASEHSLSTIMRELTKNSLVSTFVSEDIYALQYHDEAYGTEYYQTLRTFIKQGCRISETASVMHVHRNTVTYRLEKINKIVNFDVYRVPSEPKLFDYLLLSFIILDQLTADGQKA